MARRQQEGKRGLLNKIIKILRYIGLWRSCLFLDRKGNRHGRLVADYRLFLAALSSVRKFCQMFVYSRDYPIYGLGCQAFCGLTMSQPCANLRLHDFFTNLR